MYKSSFDSSLLVCAMKNLKSSEYDRFLFYKTANPNWFQPKVASFLVAQFMQIPKPTEYHFFILHKPNRFQLKLTAVSVNLRRLFGFSLHSSRYISQPIFTYFRSLEEMAQKHNNNGSISIYLYQISKPCDWNLTISQRLIIVNVYLT